MGRPRRLGDGLVAMVGIGAALVTPDGLLVMTDLPRWEIQLRLCACAPARLRACRPDWTADHPGEDVLRGYKRSFSIEWRAVDRHKMAIFDDVAHFLDPELVEGDAMRCDAFGPEGCVQRPFG